MSSKKVGLTKDALASLSKFDSLSESQLQQTQGGKWKTLWAVGPGLYQRDTKTGKYRWIQTQDYFSYTVHVMGNGWAAAPAGDAYFSKGYYGGK
jgi:hypothetical protein